MTDRKTPTEPSAAQQTAASLPVDPEVWRRVAEAELASATHARNVLLEAHQDSYKWLLASLLAINSAGMLALLNLQSVEAIARIVASASFYVGIMSALLSAYLGQRANRSLIAPVGKSMAYWITVAHDGDHVPEVWEEINIEIQAEVSRSWPVQAAGWASAICFSVGIIALGVNQLGSGQADARAAIEQTQRVAR